MNEVKTMTKAVSVEQSAKNLKNLLKNHKIARFGEGTPLWTVDLKQTTKLNAIIKWSEKTETVYLVSDMEGMPEDEKAITIPLGVHYGAMQTFADLADERISITVALRKPNTAITEEDLKRIEALPEYGTKATRGYRNAVANDEESVVLVSYVEPDIE